MYTEPRKSLFVRVFVAATASALLLVPLASQAQTGNTATGIDALYSNTTGFENTANGAYTLYFNTTGSYNTLCVKGHETNC